MKWQFRWISAFIIMMSTFWVGVLYVAPNGVLKLHKRYNESTPEDYGFLSSDVFIKADDSVELRADLILPHQLGNQKKVASSTLVVIHPLNKNTDYSYRNIWALSDHEINYLSIDGRGVHSEKGNFFNLGIQESKDISRSIDRIIELYPNMKFGVYAIGNAGNLALKAMENDHRISYGIIESAILNPIEYIKMFTGYDFGLDLPIVSNLVINRAIKLRKINLAEATLKPELIDQDILFLEVNGKHPGDLKKVYNKLNSGYKSFVSVTKSPRKGHYYNSTDSYFQAINQFLEECAL